MFSKLKIFLFLLSLSFVANLAYAATKYIVDTPFSSTYGMSRIPGSGDSDEGDTSTYSGVKCGTITSKTELGCKNIMNTSDAIATPCDGGYYTCTCPSEYNKACLVEGEQGEGGFCGKIPDVKYKSCKAITATSCNDLKAAYNNQATIKTDDNDCRQYMMRSYVKSVNCIDTDNANAAKVLCVIGNCSNMVTSGYAPDGVQSNDLKARGGINEGYCYLGSNLMNPWFCGTDYNLGTVPSCEDALMFPLVCDLEKIGEKYKSKCLFKECSNTQMTIMNKVTNIIGNTITYNTSPEVACSSNGYQAGDLIAKCMLPTSLIVSDGRFNSLYPHNVCGCPERFKYTSVSCEAENPGYKAASSRVAMPFAGATDKYYLDRCEWDSQNAIDRLTGKRSAYISEKFKYTDCLAVCPSGLTFDSNNPTDTTKDLSMVTRSCNAGGVNTACARTGPFAGVNHEKLYYCSCPKDADGNDLWHSSCPRGTLPGGRTCSLEDSVIKYELCLPQCDEDADDGKKVTGNPTTASCGVSQAWSIEADDISSGNYRCSNDKNSIVTCTDTTKYCCPFLAGASLNQTKCSEKFMAVNTTGAYSNTCLPYSYSPPAQACFLASGNKAAQWQCSCVGHKTNQECQSTDAGNAGSGEICTLDGIDSPKYPTCAKLCDANKIVEATADACKNPITDATATSCHDNQDDKDKFECGCPSSWKTVAEYCATAEGAAIPDCANGVVSGFGNVCRFDFGTDGVTRVEKYSGFMSSCPSNPNLIFQDSVGQCLTEGTDNSVSCIQNETLKFYCACPDSWQTLAEFCGTDTDCLTSQSGVGTACTFDIDAAGVRVNKYKSFSSRCPDITQRPVFDEPTQCILNDGDTIPSTPCYPDNNTGVAKYNCSCPITYKAMNECTTVVNGVMQVAAGTACNFDGYDVPKYQGCFNRCVSTAATPVVDRPNDCPLVGGVQARTEVCYLKAGDALPSYACRCPLSLNYLTIDEYCAIFTCPAGDIGCQALTGGELTTYCKKNYIGVGVPCTYDVDNANKSLDKYKDFLNACPNDRPLFYTKDECANGAIKGGVFDNVCNDRTTGQERVLCKCPDSYQSTCPLANTELAGLTCNYEGANLKYEGCYGKCDAIANSNGKGLEYLPEDENSDGECKDMLGDGATWGNDGRGGKCSRNHVLFNPCYCGAEFVNECLSMDNEVPAEGALACSIKGTTYYNSCQNNQCAEPSATTAIISVAAGDAAIGECQRQFGLGSSGKNCGVNQAECSCNPREYSELCSYPQTPPTGNDYCKYSETGLMASGENHYKLGACRVEPLLAPCGQHSISNGVSYTPSGYPTVIASSENECKSRVGTGGQTQLCEYDIGTNKGKRAYNCYYDPSKFKATENTCPIRHILGGNYVIINGVKTYESCDCHPAYKFHKYNCAGMLSGGACNQSTTNNNDGTIPTDVTQMDYFPYCACTADYSQVCDGERNVGVGEICNGKYKACVCKPDPLPENWADNYYGCPGGKQPTGVIKQNGCGGKYYQCSVTQCTWQHTQKCNGAYIEGVDSCQDSQGNIGGYKSCRCVAGHDKVCADGTVGKGDPCILNGEYKYKECVEEGTCVRGESKTCQEELHVGVNPCKKNSITYFEYCKCASGYDKLCENGEVGEGPSCKLNGKEYYSKCLKPTMTCTPDHKDACDTNQEKYDPCVNSENRLFYKCKCPSNWKNCAEGGAINAETCTDSIRGQVFDECAVQNTCSVEQNKNYKVCTASQKGTGGSCIALVGETTITKYAVCEETSACRINGYKYSCLGFDTEGLGVDSCVDESGNKLYKQCNCPSKWMTCPDKTNTKGQACTPLLENGSAGEVVYESCTCDASLYRYTCEKSSTNQGVKPDNGKSCTPKIPGSTTTQAPLYSSCTCDDLYKQTCKGNGHTKNDNDYCERVPGGEKLYKSCGCDESVYIETCRDNTSNPGMTGPSDASKKCTPIGADGNPGLPMYKSCECGRYYSLLCNGTNQIAPENDFCMVKDGGADVMKYSKCLCSEDFSLTCIPSGYNKGIYPPTVGEKDTCQSVSYVNDNITRVNHYKECKCQEAYKYTCTAADTITGATPDLYLPDNTNYCLASVESETKYTSCPCRAEYVTECKKTSENPQQEPVAGAVPCNQILSNGNLVTKYLASDCQCKANDMTGYTAVVDTNLNSAAFKAQVKTACRHEKNFVIKADGCGGTYFKCAIEDASYKYEQTTCTTSAPSGSAAWVVSGSSKSASVYNIASGQNNGSLTMYTNCDCPSSYVETTGSCAATADVARFDIPRCQQRRYGDTYYNLPCNQQGGMELDAARCALGTRIIPDGSKCINTNGESKYRYCKCNRTCFTDNDEKDSGRGSEWLKCMDYLGSWYVRDYVK